jgi:hypothetical protein
MIYFKREYSTIHFGGIAKASILEAALIISAVNLNYLIKISLYGKDNFSLKTLMIQTWYIIRPK